MMESGSYHILGSPVGAILEGKREGPLQLGGITLAGGREERRVTSLSEVNWKMQKNLKR